MVQFLKKTLSLVCLVLAWEASHKVQAVQPSTIYVYDMNQGLGNKRAMMASLAGVVARTSADVALGYQTSEFDGDPEFWVDEYVAQNLVSTWLKWNRISSHLMLIGIAQMLSHSRIARAERWSRRRRNPVRHAPAHLT